MASVCRRMARMRAWACISCAIGLARLALSSRFVLLRAAARSLLAPSFGEMLMTETLTADRKKMVQVLIVDDHPIVREGLAARIARQPDLNVCGEAEDVADAFELVKTTQPD